MPERGDQAGTALRRSLAGRTIGMLAGGGPFPREVADAITARGGRVHALLLEGEAGAELADLPHTWIRWGSVGRIIATLQKRTDGELILVGRVKRPDLLRLGPDLGFLRHLPALVRMLSGGDDAVLTRVVRFFEARGIRIRGVHEILPELLAGTGRIAGSDLAADAALDLALGRAVLDALAPFDIGQAVVVRAGKLRAIEGVEGTDRMLQRVADSDKAGPGAPRRGLLVKAPKSGQELRVDMPAIGPRTVENAAKARLAGIAVKAGEVLIADRAALDEAVGVTNVAVHGFAGPPNAAAPRRGWPRTVPITRVAGRSPGQRCRADIAKGHATLAALVPFGAGGAVVVARRHVLAVAAAENPVDMLARVAALGQWGTGRLGLPSGLLVIAADGVTDPSSWQEIAMAAWRAGLTGIAIARRGPGGDIPAAARAVRCPWGRFVVSTSRLHAQGDGPP